jgi:hypothetical protein
MQKILLNIYFLILKMSSGDQRLANMQTLLTTHIGLSMGAITTINIIINSNILTRQFSHYVIISLLIYSFITIITGVVEYIEKFNKLHNDQNKHKDPEIKLSKWDYTMSMIYLVIGLMMIMVNVFLCMSIVKHLRN